jgi:hypothetical protein
MGKSIANGPLLKLCQRQERHVRSSSCGTRRREKRGWDLCAFYEILREVVCGDGLAVTGEYSSMYDVLELSNIPWPVVSDECFKRFGVYVLHL